MSECKKEGCSRETCLINGDYCSSTCWIVGLERENAALKKENENLSVSIKGMASGKANLDKSYQELEGLYGRLEKANEALVKRWEELGEWVKFNQNVIGAGDVLERMIEAGSK